MKTQGWLKYAVAVVVACATVHHASAQCLSWDSNFGVLNNGANSAVRQMLVTDSGSGSQLHAFGHFTTIGGVAAAGAARWNGTSWSPLGTGTSIRANEVIMWNNAGTPTLVAGLESTYGPVGQASTVVTWNGSAWTPIPGPITQRVFALAEYQGKVFVGGELTAVGGERTDRLAAWNGSSWQRFDPAASVAIHSYSFWSSSLNEVLSLCYMVGDNDNVSVWSFNGTRWLRRASTTVPFGSSGYRSATFDSQRNRALFLNSQSGQMYETSGGTLTPVGAPAPWAPMQDVRLAYDSLRDRVIMAGGYNNQTHVQFSQTWSLDCSTMTWTNLQPATSFTPRRVRTIAYDAQRDRVILHGGYNADTSQYFYDTWEWDGAAWTQAPVQAFQNTTLRPLLVYNSALQSMLMIRQSTSGMNAGRETYAFTPGTGWTLIEPATNYLTGTENGEHVSACDPNTGDLFQISCGITWHRGASGWQPAPFGGLDNTVATLCVHDDGNGERLWIGGSFNRAGPLAADCIAKYDGTLFSDGTNGEVGGNGVSVLYSVPSGPFAGLYAGGGFNRFTPDFATGAAKWNGTTWSSLAGARGALYEFLLHDEGNGLRLFASGGLTVPAGLTSNILQFDGTTWTNHAPTTPQRNVGLLGHDDGAGMRLYAFGSLSSTTDPQFRNMMRYGAMCAAPQFMTHPSNFTPTMPTQGAVFTTVATGTPPITYQWRRNSTPISDVSGRITGASTAQLTVQGWSLNDVGVYDCVATNAHGQTISNSATFTIPGLPPYGPAAITPIITIPCQVPNSTEMYTTGHFQALSATHLAGYLGRPNGIQDIVTVQPGSVNILMTNATATHLPEGGETITRVNLLHAESPTRFLYESTHDVGPRDVRASWQVDSGNVSFIRREDIEYPTFWTVPSVTRVNTARNGHFLTRAGSGAESAVWQWSPGLQSQLVARAGASFPGSSITPHEVAYYSFLNQAGDITVSTAGTVSAIWRRINGTWSKVVSSGDPVPSMSGQFFFSRVENRALLENGDVVYTGSWGGTPMKYGVFVAHRDGTSMMLFRNDFVVDSQTGPRAIQGTMDLLGATNQNSSLLLYAPSRDAGCVALPCEQPYSLWLLRIGFVPVEIWRENLTVPHGTWPHTTLPLAWNRFFALNSGQIVLFNATFFGGSSGGILAWMPQTGLIAIVSPGNQLEVGEGVYKTVLSAGIVDQGNDDRWDSGALFDDQTFVAEIYFTDNTKGYYTCEIGNFIQAYRACPTVILEPNNVTASIGSTASLFTNVVGQATLAHQWRRNGEVLTNGPTAWGTLVSGAQSPTLILAGIHNDDAATYDCVVSNSCGSATTSTATIMIGSTCDSIDFNNDGSIYDPTDIDAFLSVYSEGPCIPETATCNDIDFNNDGSVFDPIDIDAFLSVYSEGPCF